jgi:putative ABC transport system ATP-binding protein
MEVLAVTSATIGRTGAAVPQPESGAAVPQPESGAAVPRPESGADGVILEAAGLVKVYRTGGGEFPAVRGVDLECRAGEFTVIMGASGSGKSTLLYLLSGLDSATAGEVRIKGRSLGDLSARELAKLRTHRIGYVYQQIHLIPDLSILDNIAFPAYLAGKPRAEARGRAMALMKRFDIAGLADRLPSQVSGGQQQRAAIARALINGPDLLFADEPTGALSRRQGEFVLDLLTELNREGQSIVMATHDLKAACRADRLVLVKDGEIAGALDLPKYDERQAAEREQRIWQFLKERE